VRNGKKVRMMGDDTWMKLFPSHFSVAHPFDSFNVKDLHTVSFPLVQFFGIILPYNATPLMQLKSDEFVSSSIFGVP
jgi:predicted AlkP superfamily pyrophosphatase or phosphodiesterase